MRAVWLKRSVWDETIADLNSSFVNNSDFEKATLPWVLGSSSINDGKVKKKKKKKRRKGKTKHNKTAATTHFVRLIRQLYRWNSTIPSGAQKTVTVIIHDFSKVLFHFGKTMCFRPFRILLNKSWKRSGKLTGPADARWADKINVCISTSRRYCGTHAGRYGGRHALALFPSPVARHKATKVEHTVFPPRVAQILPSVQCGVHLSMGSSAPSPASPLISLIYHSHSVKFNGWC